MVNYMVKEHSLGLMEKSMKGNGRMGRKMVKELSFMEKVNWKVKSMKGNTRMGFIGTEHYTTKTETS